MAKPRKVRLCTLPSMKMVPRERVTKLLRSLQATRLRVWRKRLPALRTAHPMRWPAPAVVGRFASAAVKRIRLTVRFTRPKSLPLALMLILQKVMTTVRRTMNCQPLAPIQVNSSRDRATLMISVPPFTKGRHAP